MQKTNANYPLQYCHFPRFTLSLNKISGTSAIKMKVSGLSFCIALGLDKILTLGNVNKSPFLSLNRFFALSLQTI